MKKVLLIIPTTRVMLRGVVSVIIVRKNLMHTLIRLLALSVLLSGSTVGPMMAQVAVQRLPDEVAVHQGIYRIADQQWIPDATAPQKTLDDLFNNTTGTGGFQPLNQLNGVDAPATIFDWATLEVDGWVTHVGIEYATSLAAPGPIIVVFYTGTTNAQDGTEVIELTIDNPLGSGSGEVEVVKMTVEAEKPFLLLSGPFGYGFGLGDNQTGPLTATGGTGLTDFFRILGESANRVVDGFFAQFSLLLQGHEVDVSYVDNPIFAAPGGNLYDGKSSCDDPTTPCNLAGALEDAADGTGNETVYVLLPDTGATALFEENLVIDLDVTFDTYYLKDDKIKTGVDGGVAVDGVTIGENTILTLPANVDLRPDGLELHDGAEINGDGFVNFTATGSQNIQLGTLGVGCSGASPKTTYLGNLRIDKIGGSVTVRDQCAIDDESDLFISNRLEVLNGVLNMLDNNLHMVGPTNDGGITGGVEIGAGAVITGDGTFFISVDSEVLGGHANDSSDCYEITGDGNLNMAFDKNSDAGVCIDLNEIGSGGISFNRLGALFVREATTHNGTFKAEGASRTEFWELNTITSNLEVDGPGDEVDPTGTSYTNGTCETGSGKVGNESGVYFFTTVTIGEQLITTNTDDPGTIGCVEGVWFMGDSDPASDSANAAKAEADDPNPSSTVVETYTSDGVVGIYLGCFNFFHNVEYQGNFAFDESPIFTLCSAADAYLIGTLGADYTPFAIGNKVLFTGGDDQDLLYNKLLDIQSVQINKDSSTVVEINETSAAFLIDTSLEVISGRFTTNGLLDANAGGGLGTGATVVINRDGDGDGILDAGNSDRAYLSDDVEHTPRKVKYTGSSRSTGDEIPGPSSGSFGGPEIFLDELEVFQSDPASVITLSKDFTLVTQVTLTQGILDVGSSKLKLENLLIAAIGDGEVVGLEESGSRGELIFPTEHIDDFTVGVDGIDLLYFGTEDRTVGLLWPPTASRVPERKLDGDTILNVTIDPVYGDSIDISLRADDDEYTINGDLIVTSPATFNRAGAVLTATEEAALEEEATLPEAFALRGNYPNPFNPSTTITYAVPFASRVLLEVYDVQGRRVAVLTDGMQRAGRYERRWSARSVASGVYFVRMVATAAEARQPSFTAVQAIVLSK